MLSGAVSFPCGLEISREIEKVLHDEAIQEAVTFERKPSQSFGKGIHLAQGSSGTQPSSRHSEALYLKGSGQEGTFVGQDCYFLQHGKEKLF